MQQPITLGAKYFHVVSFFMAFVSTVSVTTTAAQVDQKRLLNGTFIFSPNTSDNIKEAIEIATSEINVVVRQVERTKLQRLHAPSQRISIANDKKQVSVQLDQDRPIVSAADGQPSKWTAPSGDKYDLVTKWDNGQLVQSFTRQADRRTNILTVSADGRTLTMNVVRSSLRLTKPIAYKLVYVKVM